MKGRELRVVVEHLLEMRDGPEAIGGITMVAPAEMVADSSARHPVERERHHLQRIGCAGAGTGARTTCTNSVTILRRAGLGRVGGRTAPQVLVEQKLEIDHLGKLRAARVIGPKAETTVFGVELTRKLLKP